MGKFQILLGLTLVLLLSIFFISIRFSLSGQSAKQEPERKTLFSRFNLFPVNNQAEVYFLGDIMLGRSIMTKSLKLSDPIYPFRKVADNLKKSDLVFANLEAPFVKDCPKTDTGMIFCADPSLVVGLRASGINIVTIANNHMANYGQGGIDQTKETLKQSGILWVGEGNLAVKKIKGIKFGFLGFNFLNKNPNEADLKLISDSARQTDYLIVSVHWGEEYQAKANENQRNIARQLISAGAAVIIGHHPHWVQDSELIEGRPVYYSLGNFVFDQFWSEATKKGLAVKMVFSKQGIVEKKEYPIKISSTGQPEID